MAKTSSLYNLALANRTVKGNEATFFTYGPYSRAVEKHSPHKAAWLCFRIKEQSE